MVKGKFLSLLSRFSCTVPLAISQGVTVPFRTFEYDGSRPGSPADINPETGLVWGVERTQEGYVEVIEMGTVVDPDLQAAILHGSDGVPADCTVSIDFVGITFDQN